MIEKMMRVMKICEILKKLDIDPITIEHPETISCEDSKVYYDKYGFDHRTYGLCKNLLIRDKKGKRFWLIIFDYRKKVDFHKLRYLLASSKIGMATNDDLIKILGIQRGEVSIFSILNDSDNKVEVIIDSYLLHKERLVFHPNYNGISMFIKVCDVFKFLDYSGRKFLLLDIPEINKMGAHNNNNVKKII